jgi:hypothetical protein
MEPPALSSHLLTTVEVACFLFKKQCLQNPRSTGASKIHLICFPAIVDWDYQRVGKWLHRSTIDSHESKTSVLIWFWHLNPGPHMW